MANFELIDYPAGDQLGQHDALRLGRHGLGNSRGVGRPHERLSEELGDPPDRLSP